jgi:3-hydroxyacyl-[acyl-carrier-protein] dehydratase
VTLDPPQLLKTYRKKPLSDCAVSLTPCNYTDDVIKQIIPHREPLLLIDAITGIDLKGELICGTRLCRSDDPVFQGHFPENPVYPGSLQLESAGQIALCLCYFLAAQSLVIPAKPQKINAYVTKILGAQFLEPVTPGSTMELMARRLCSDSFFETYIGQILIGRKICSVFMVEFYFL